MTTLVLPKGKSLSKLFLHSRMLDQISKSLLLGKMKDLHQGHLTIVDGAQEQSFGDPNAELKAKINIRRSSFYSRTLFGGSIGNAESYVDADWECSDLPSLVRIFVLNRDVLQSIDSGIGKLLNPIQKYMHGLRENSVDGSRENIKAHYDIGNDFFKLFLDETMMYSSGLFKTKESTLREASQAKIEAICERLELKPTDHLVEIGTGWGSLAIHAAQKYGCQVTTTTISTEQFDYTNARIKELGLGHKINVLFQDYRLLTGAFDKLVSVEMIEAVGLNHLPEYFKKCSSLIKPDGLMVLQAITIRDEHYELAKNSVDFIQRHIFPGCGIPAIHAMMSSIAMNTDLILVDQKDHAEDYAETLKRWSENLRQNENQITALGYPSYLYRLWQYYFSYCEGGFRERAIGLSQMTFTKPRYKNRSFV